MIQFACPGCEGEHEVEDSYAGYTAKCVHCGVAIEIPDPATDEPVDDDEIPVDETPEAVEVTPPPQPRRESPSRPRGTSHEAVESKSKVEPVARKWWADRRVQIGAGASVVLVGLVAVFASGGSKPTPAPAPLPPVVKQEEPKQAVSPPAPAPAVVVPPVILPPPAALPPIGLAASHLATALRLDPAGTNERLAGRATLLSGLVELATPEGLVISSGPGTASLRCSFTLPSTLRAVAGGAAQLPERPVLPPGQSVTLQGVYSRDGRFEQCEIASLAAPGDREFLGRVLETEGIVQAVVPPPKPGETGRLILEGPTDARVGIEWVFKPTDAASLATLKPGQRVAVRGTCGGRFQLTVRMDNSVLVPMESAASTTQRFSLANLCYAYEADLRVSDPVASEGLPVAVTAARLAEAFQTDPRAAWGQYGGSLLEVSGTIVERRPESRTVYLEMPTSSRFRIAAAFTPSRFREGAEQTNVVLRCTCSGFTDPQTLRLDNAESVDPDGPNVPRITADFLPLKPGQELRYDSVQYGKTRDHFLRRIVMTFVDAENFQVRQIQTGTFTGKSLFQKDPPPVQWSKDPRKLNVPLFALQYRVQDQFVEVGHPTTPQPGGKQVAWDPILKIGAKAGQSWKFTDPGGVEVTYTVAGFRQDGQGRRVVEIRRVSLHPQDRSGTREESTIAYAQGVGELGRTVARLVGAAPPIVISETKLVETPLDAGRLESTGAGGK